MDNSKTTPSEIRLGHDMAILDSNPVYESESEVELASPSPKPICNYLIAAYQFSEFPILHLPYCGWSKSLVFGGNPVMLTYCLHFIASH